MIKHQTLFLQENNWKRKIPWWPVQDMMNQPLAWWPHGINLNPNPGSAGISTTHYPVCSELHYPIENSLLFHLLSSLPSSSIPSLFIYPLSLSVPLALGCWHWLSNTCAVESITLNSHKLVREQNPCWWEQHMYTGVIIYLQRLLQTEILCVERCQGSKYWPFPWTQGK